MVLGNQRVRISFVLLRELRRPCLGDRVVPARHRCDKIYARSFSCPSPARCPRPVSCRQEKISNSFVTFSSHAPHLRHPLSETFDLRLRSSSVRPVIRGVGLRALGALTKGKISRFASPDREQRPRACKGPWLPHVSCLLQSGLFFPVPPEHSSCERPHRSGAFD